MDMKIVLANAFSVNMLERGGSYNFIRVDPVKLTDHFGDISRNTIGHADIENLAGLELLKMGIIAPPAHRSTFRFTEGVILLIAQYRGPRLEAGATELPAGAVLEWWAVMADCDGSVDDCVNRCGDNPQCNRFMLCREGA